MKLNTHRTTVNVLSALLVVIVLCQSRLAAADDAWNGFLGPQRNGVSSETNLIDAFPQNGPREIWRQSLGEGMANVAVAGKLVITQHQSSSEQLVVAFAVDSGKQAWSTAIGPHYRNGQGNGPRATPTVHKNVVFAYSGEGILAALRLTDGTLLWKKSLPVELGCKPAEYGMASSPLIVGELVVVQVGETGTVAAFEQSSGKLAWQVGNDPAGYSSPILVGSGSSARIFAFTGSSALSISADGKQQWRVPYKTDYFCNTATPAFHDNKLLISAGENHGSTLLDLSASQPRAIWESLGRRSSLRAEWQTPVLLDGFLYGFDNVGSAGPVTHLTCVEFKTGKQVWQEPRFGKGNLIAADGKLFISTMRGDLVIVKASPDKFSELARAKVIETTRQAPAISGGRIFLRGKGELVCFDGRKN